VAKVKWLPDAKDDIERLHEFLRKKNPKAASNAIKAIRAGARKLEAFPQVGRLMDDDGQRRELFVAFGQGGYVLRYMLDDDDVVVIRVWHALEKR
jgi:plasmid stabilization system protein ParE